MNIAIFDSPDSAIDNDDILHLRGICSYKASKVVKDKVDNKANDIFEETDSATEKKEEDNEEDSEFKRLL